MNIPRISDHTVYYILDNLLMLDGEKLSYRSLDVEQIGSVYEAIMGFEVMIAEGLSIALRPYDLVVDIEKILKEQPSERVLLLQNEAQCKLSSKEISAVKEAKRPVDLLAAIEGKISSRTPELIPVGGLFLQPGEFRRRSGSHYTPRKLTQPIVTQTLRPVLEGLGEFPTAEQILSLRVCDLAMGSGAFLVETCRQLAQKLVEAWGIVLGMGFTFDDSNPDATSIEEMRRLIEDNPKNKECIFPYIGGEEVNSSPTHGHHRYVINFGEMSEDEARRYPDLMGIVERKVKPERDKLIGRNSIGTKRGLNWWLFGSSANSLYEAIKPLDRVLVIARVSQSAAFTFLPNNIVFSEQLVVIASNNYSTFAILQSRIHEVWARFFGSSMKDDLRYTPSDCFETFPWTDPPQPPLLRGESESELDTLLRGESESESETESESEMASNSGGSNPSPSGSPPYQGGVRGGSNLVRGGSSLETIGQIYYEYRSEIMIKNKQGLTETYNRFHTPDEWDEDIIRLRQLHDQMDRAVLDAYGWSDLDNTCGFALDYLDINEEEELHPLVQERITSGDLFFPTTQEALDFDSLARTSKRKLPWRYRWSEATHDEVLARLLDLNQKRAEEEILSGKSAQTKSQTKSTRKPKSKKTTKMDEGQIELFGEH